MIAINVTVDLRIGQALEFYKLLVTEIKKDEKKYVEEDNHI